MATTRVGIKPCGCVTAGGAGAADVGRMVMAGLRVEKRTGPVVLRQCQCPPDTVSRTREQAMEFVLRQCREFLGTPGTTLPQYEEHVVKLCGWIGESLAGPPAAPANKEG